MPNAMILALVFSFQQALDVWTTYRVLKMGGSELNGLVRAVMARIGVLPALLVLKGAAAAAAIAAAQYLDGGQVSIGLGILIALYAYVLRGNFKALAELKARA